MLPRWSKGFRGNRNLACLACQFTNMQLRRASLRFLQLFSDLRRVLYQLLGRTGPAAELATGCMIKEIPGERVGCVPDWDGRFFNLSLNSMRTVDECYLTKGLHHRDEGRPFWSLSLSTIAKMFGSMMGTAAEGERNASESLAGVRSRPARWCYPMQDRFQTPRTFASLAAQHLNACVSTNHLEALSNNSEAGDVSGLPPKYTLHLILNGEQRELPSKPM